MNRRGSHFLLFVLLAVIALTAFFPATAKAATRGTNHITGEEIFAEGEINALVVRLGFSDYPLSDENPLYKSDDFLMNLFEGSEGGINVAGRTYAGISDYFQTASYGKISIKVGNILDIEQKESVSYYRDLYNNDLLAYVKDIPDHNIDLAAYDVFYFFDCADDEAFWSEDILDGYAFSTVEELGGKEYRYTLIGAAGTPIDSPYDNFRIAAHETGHLLFDLDDLYHETGFVLFPFVENNNAGNLMALDRPYCISDIDGYSKYAIGMLAPENIQNYVAFTEGNATVHMSPVDSTSAEGLKVTRFDYGVKKIFVEYIAGTGNNYNENGTKAGFRFYLADEEAHLTSIYYSSEDGEDETAYWTFGEGETIDDLFGMGISIYDIKCGDEPSFSFTMGEPETVPESQITRLDFTDQKDGTSTVTLVENESGGASGIHYLIVRTKNDTYIIQHDYEEMTDSDTLVVSVESLSEPVNIGKIYKALSTKEQTIYSDEDDILSFDLFEGHSLNWHAVGEHVEHIIDEGTGERIVLDVLSGDESQVVLRVTYYSGKEEETPTPVPTKVPGKKSDGKNTPGKDTPGKNDAPGKPVPGKDPSGKAAEDGTSVPGKPNPEGKAAVATGTPAPKNTGNADGAATQTVTTASSSANASSTSPAGAQTSSTDAAKTGDTASVIYWIGLFLAAAYLMYRIRRTAVDQP